MYTVVLCQQIVWL